MNESAQRRQKPSAFASMMDFALHMTRRAKSRPTSPRARGLILVGAVALAVLLLLLRMIVFVFGHGRHR